MFFQPAILTAVILAAALYAATFAASGASAALSALVSFVAGSFGSLAAAWLSTRARSQALIGLAPAGLAIVFLGLVFRIFLPPADPRILPSRILAYALGACAIALVAQLLSSPQPLAMATGIFASVGAANVGAMLLGESLFSAFGAPGLMFPLIASALGWLACVIAVLAFPKRSRWSELTAAALALIGLYLAVRLSLDGDWMLFAASAAGLIGGLLLVRFRDSFPPLMIFAVLMLVAYVFGSRAGLANPVRGITPESASACAIGIAAIGLLSIVVFHPETLARAATPLVAAVLFFAYGEQVQNAIARVSDIELFRVRFAIDFSLVPVFVAALLGAGFAFGFRALLPRFQGRMALLPGIAALVTPLAVGWIFHWLAVPSPIEAMRVSPLGAASLGAFTAAAAIAGFLLAVSRNNDPDGTRAALLFLIEFLGALSLAAAPFFLA